MTTREIDIKEFDRKFNEILNSLTVSDVLDWLNNDREDQAKKLLKGETITITSSQESTFICFPNMENYIVENETPNNLLAA